MQKLKFQSILSTLVLAVGLLLMAYKIYADSEPGLIPMVLVLSGTAWFAITRVRRRSHSEPSR